MSTTYRLYRNIEASIVDQITTALATAGLNVRISKSFKEIYKGTLPAILINVEDTSFNPLEIGSKAQLKFPLIYLRIFPGESGDGLREDLANFLEDLIIAGFTYYTYIITNDVASKVAAGRINVERITDSRREFRNQENLDAKDRFRHLIIFEVTVKI